jgi:beta-keto acid cleavage enzyme
VSEQELNRAHAVTDEILSVLSVNTVKPVLLHGENASAWPLLERAVKSGFSTRIGLEDVSILPDGTTVASNVGLVAAAVRLR